MAERVIIDTDPGHDDAFAILLALAAPELEVLGLTTVAGNVPVATTTANARRIVELAGRPLVPVFAGADRPLLRPAMHAHDIHGKMGIDGYDWPEPARPAEAEHAVDWMVARSRPRRRNRSRWSCSGRRRTSPCCCAARPSSRIASAASS
jgi:purine nucleosidase